MEFLRWFNLLPYVQDPLWCAGGGAGAVVQPRPPDGPSITPAHHPPVLLAPTASRLIAPQNQILLEKCKIILQFLLLCLKFRVWGLEVGIFL
jgi:hypothetical protein